MGSQPTPVISHAILAHNRGRTTGAGLADGIVITPSHNPPRDGGFKYNPTNGGPADVDITNGVQKRANELLRSGSGAVRRMPYEQALHAATTRHHDYVRPFVSDLGNVVDLAAIKKAGFAIAVDPLGGASVAYWMAIKEIHGLNLEIVNTGVDPTFSFMTVDHDGKIRMDCSSPYAMAGLVKLKDKYRVAFGNDPDSDRHGIVTPSAGLMNPNHYLAVAIRYLFTHRAGWKATAGVGKTLVSSSIIDRVAAALGRRLVEVPVGFKWFVDGLFDGSLGFWRRGERGGEFPADGWKGVVYRQGWDHFELAGRGDYRGDGQGSGGAFCGADGEVWHALLHAGGSGGDAGAEGSAQEAFAGGGEGHQPGGRADCCQAYGGAGEPCGDRGAEGGDGEWVVCGAAEWDGERVQDLCGEFEERGTFGEDSGRRRGG